MRAFYLTLVLFFSIEISFCQIISDQPWSPGQISISTKTQPKKINRPSKRTCSTDEHTRYLQSKYEHFESTAEFENRLSILSNQLLLSRTEEDVFTIPVVVHIVHNGEDIGVGTNISEAQVISQIEVLNEDFRRMGAGSNDHPNGADINIEFVLAVIGPNGQVLSEPGINRINGGQPDWDIQSIDDNLKPTTIWDPTKYFNIWTLKFGGDNTETLGYAQFPNLSELEGLDRSYGPAETDGIVVRYNAFGRAGNVQAPFNQGRTATHEVGHWLGLRHIWGDGDCTVDDFCADTPTAGQPNYTCTVVNSCDDGENDANDMIENYMDYTNDACMNIFTQDQKLRMRTVMTNSPRRRELVNSTVADPGDQPFAEFAVNTESGCVGTTVQFTDNSTNNPSSWTWNFYDAQGNLLNTFTAQNLNITFNGAGVYSVELIVANGAGSSTIRKNNLITIISDQVVLSLLEDSEDPNNILNDWVFSNKDNDRSWGYTTLFSAYGNGTNSLLFDNYSIDTDPTGTVDAMISPPLDLTGAETPVFSFDYAYAPYSQQYVDTLKLIYSLDCGVTWNVLWSRGGNELATAPATTDPFEPANSQWKSIKLTLKDLQGQSSVHIAIQNVSGWGNYIYLDNIRFAYEQTTQPVVANFRAAQLQVCEGDIIQYEDLSTENPTSWNWTFEGAAVPSSSAQNPQAEYLIPGLYDVALMASNGVGGSTEVKLDYVEVIPLPEVIVEGSNEVCIGSEVTLTASGGQNIKWLSRGNVIFEGSTYSFTLFEDIDLEVVAENELGCIGSTNFVVRVVEDPVVVASAEVSGVCSEDESFNLTGSGAVSYEWFAGSTFLGEGELIEAQIQQSTTFTVVGYTANKICRDTAEVTVEFFEISAPVITEVDGQLESSVASTYQWFFEGQAIAGATAKTFIPEIQGNYTVQTADVNGCEALSDPYFVVITSIDKPLDKIKFYPNPVNDKIYLDRLKGEVFFEIFSVTGTRLKIDKVNSDNTIDVSYLNKGIYLLRVTDNSSLNEQFRFVKQ